MSNATPRNINNMNNNPYQQYNLNQNYCMPQQLNPISYPMNSFSQMPMNSGYPQRQQFSNYPNAAFNQYTGYNVQQPFVNQNFPNQQNKAFYPTSVLDLF